MYEDTRNQLKRSFDNLAPDCLSAIKSASITKIESEEILFSELNSMDKARSSRKIWTLAAMAAVFLCFITVFFYGRNHVIATVSVCDDSEVILSINKSNYIVGVEVKEDPLHTINPEDFKGKHLDEGLLLALQAIQMTEKEEKGCIDIRYHGSHSGDDETKTIIRDISNQYTEHTGCKINASDQSAHKVVADNQSPSLPAKTISDRTATQNTGKQPAIKENESPGKDNLITKGDANSKQIIPKRELSDQKQHYLLKEKDDSKQTLPAKEETILPKESLSEEDSDIPDTKSHEVRSIEEEVDSTEEEAASSEEDKLEKDALSEEDSQIPEEIDDEEKDEEFVCDTPIHREEINYAEDITDTKSEDAEDQNSEDKDTEIQKPETNRNDMTELE